MLSVRRTCALLLIVAVAFGAAGCRSNPALRYVRYRAEDLADVADIGLTFSTRPYISLYACGVSIVTGGYSYFDGYFLGMGGGQVGFIPHYNHCYGLLFAGHEEIGFGSFDKTEPETLWTQNQGIAGVFMPPMDGTPAYVPACTHFLHLGFLGAVANLRYMEMIDFLLGLGGLDIAKDDGRKFGRYPWQKEREYWGDWDTSWDDW